LNSTEFSIYLLLIQHDFCAILSPFTLWLTQEKKKINKFKIAVCSAAGGIMHPQGNGDVCVRAAAFWRQVTNPLADTNIFSKEHTRSRPPTNKK
jgi:hypothetical protein